MIYTFSHTPWNIISHFSDHYIVSVSWINSTAVSAIWMNRSQNLSVVVHCLQQNNWMCYEVSYFYDIYFATFVFVCRNTLTIPFEQARNIQKEKHSSSLIYLVNMNICVCLQDVMRHLHTIYHDTTKYVSKTCKILFHIKHVADLVLQLLT